MNNIKEQNMEKILKTDGIVKTIYHIGDVHVRKNSDRDEEYREVFENMYKKIKENNNENSLIVVVGDIFHDGLSGSAVRLVKNLFIELCKISDVIIFRGNHDQTSKFNRHKEMRYIHY